MIVALLGLFSYFFPLLNTVTITLSHLLRDNRSDIFETCLVCSPTSVVVHPQICFRSINKYGRRLGLSSLSHLRNQWRNFIKSLLWIRINLMCRHENDSSPSANMAGRRLCSPKFGSGPSTNMAALYEIATSPLPNTDTVSLSYLHRDNWSDVFETCLGCSPSGLVVHAQNCLWAVNIYGRRQSSWIFLVIASP